jgi:hypothetical protein
VEYGLIAFGSDGVERPERDGLFSQTLLEQAATQAVTNIFFFSHGWMGDVPAAVEQYDKWIDALMRSPNLEKAKAVFPGFRPLLIGLHWPSLPWGDEEPGADGSFAATGGPKADELFEEYVHLLGSGPEITAPLRVIMDEARRNVAPDSLPDNVREAYLELDAALGLGSGGVSAPPDADREGFDPETSYQAANEEGANFGEFSLGGILGPLRQLSYWTMKKRARKIGETGMHDFLKNLQAATANRAVRIHLMGHSFGTIVVSGMLGGPDARGALPRPIDSLALVQGAVSLWSYSAGIPLPNAGAGYFSRIVSDRKVRGSIVTTKSSEDYAVRILYPLSSRIHGSSAFGTSSNGEGYPEFGGIGAFGIQGLPDISKKDLAMLPAHVDYDFSPGVIYNLDGSRFICKKVGVSGAHCDIAGPEVAHAIWAAAFSSVPA